jgi:hypothetical protein
MVKDAYVSKDKHFQKVPDETMANKLLLTINHTNLFNY